MARFIVLLSFALLVGCAAQPPGPEIFESAERAIAAAEQAGAEELSPVELRFARERLQLARTAVENRKYDAALFAIEQSEINSELAIEQSRTARERRRLNELRRSNEELQQELTGIYGEDFE
ncbi:DUF4398 domain-containing protein [Marinihelvus fidelis]|uniref:DUF4398 domain-containing protein n=1 Tax=Marinihelvus fidelis TaxID=2613842 RepID=A0A5N0T439_9GAMM|nr:DUF4398 domain-containing protein [Marinihelvus fidelis]KAA9129622.1 DUF4398 domain-containing protein [Marinihelvus fidelis]